MRWASWQALPIYTIPSTPTAIVSVGWSAPPRLRWAELVAKEEPRSMITSSSSFSWEIQEWGNLACSWDIRTIATLPASSPPSASTSRSSPSPSLMGSRVRAKWNYKYGTPPDKSAFVPSPRLIIEEPWGFCWSMTFLMKLALRMWGNVWVVYRERVAGWLTVVETGCGKSIRTQRRMWIACSLGTRQTYPLRRG